MSTDAITTSHADAPTTELVSGAVGDRCPNCQTPLAPDQRYCVNCGERRGRARFSADTLTSPAVLATASAPTPPYERRPRFSSAATLVAGVATLLIALGVGVLIGHYSANSAPTRQAQQIITVPGGSGAPTTSASTPSSTPSTARSGKKSTKTTVVHVNAKVAKAANSAAAKVLGSSGNLSKNVTQTVGGSCNGGAGCQNGKFTGNFFSGN